MKSGDYSNNIDDIQARIRDIESRVSGESVSIEDGEYVFTSETELEKWLSTERVPSLGMF